MTDPRTEIRDPGRVLSLWVGLLLAPAAWLTGLEVGYLLVRPGCVRGTMLPQHTAHAAVLLIALIGMAVAWRAHRRSGEFMATLGVATSALFVLVIIAQWVPTFLIHPCQ
jgi:hypothetical protein